MMKPIPFLIASVLIFSAWSCTKASEPRAQASAVAAPASAAEAEAVIVQLEKDWVLAIEKKDTATLDRLLAVDFVGTSPTAHTYTKEDAVGDIKDARYVVAKMDLDEVSANIYGDTAVSFTSQEEKSSYAGSGYQRALPFHRRLGEEGRPLASRGVSRHAIRPTVAGREVGEIEIRVARRTRVARPGDLWNSPESGPTARTPCRKRTRRVTSMPRRRPSINSRAFIGWRRTAAATRHASTPGTISMWGPTSTPCTSVLIKIPSRPGLVYQENLKNEIASLLTINRSLPESRYFPFIRDHGQLRDGRVYLIASFFLELPLATAIGKERIPGKTVAYLQTALEIARALEPLHALKIYHVDLNPMNILVRLGHGRPVVRIIDFESTYEWERHAAGQFYDPPSTPGYSAPEISRQPPDARADVFSLGAVLYTMLAGYEWTWEADVWTCASRDRDLDPDLKRIVLEAVDLDPRNRYPSMEVFHASLAAHLEAIWPGRQL